MTRVFQTFTTFPPSDKFLHITLCSQIELAPTLDSPAPSPPSPADSDSSFATVHSDDDAATLQRSHLLTLTSSSDATSRDATRMTSHGMTSSRDGVWRRNTSARHSVVSPGHEVERVNVNNCAVCVIL